MQTGLAHRRCIFPSPLPSPESQTSESGSSCTLSGSSRSLSRSWGEVTPACASYLSTRRFRPCWRVWCHSAPKSCSLDAKQFSINKEIQISKFHSTWRRWFHAKKKPGRRIISPCWNCSYHSYHAFRTPQSTIWSLWWWANRHVFGLAVPSSSSTVTWSFAQCTSWRLLLAPLPAHLNKQTGKICSWKFLLIFPKLSD